MDRAPTCDALNAALDWLGVGRLDHLYRRRRLAPRYPRRAAPHAARPRIAADSESRRWRHGKSRYPEPLTMVWIAHLFDNGFNVNPAFKLLRK
ncbi:MAG: hypothetical protein Q8O34_09865 [Rhodocyclaceae bacterium]|nr:hypothetical protein [Rhodocyclaceae bacterium]